jgi:adenylate cyclase
MLKVRELSWTFYAVCPLGLVALCAQARVEPCRLTLVVTYAGGPQVKSAVGPSLLEISRMNGIPHTSVCGGRARCSTCRVRIDHGGDALPAPTAAEHATLQRIGAPANIRLACQLRPTTSIAVTRLVAPSANPQMRLGHDASSGEGVERPVAILFSTCAASQALAAPLAVRHRLSSQPVFASVGSVIRSRRIDNHAATD